MELPVSFADRTRSLLGDEEYNKLIDALNGEQPVSIRLNEAKLPHVSAALLRSCSERVLWASAGFYLDRRLTFTFDPLFHAGCYYVQEASSMFVEQALRRYVGEAPVMMLDLCAAPGGKSTHARSILPEGSLLVANEVIRNRSQVLAENLTKWGNPGVVVTNNDPADFSGLESFFDLILTDVPCSGEGMFRKDPVARSEWSLENVEICRQRQRRILTDVWPSLKPGGLLIYSTCTYNTEENEENIRWIRDEFGAEILPLNVPEEWNIIMGADFPVYRFLPHRTKGEGFFLSVLRKPETDIPETRRRPVSTQGKKKPAPVVSKEQLAAARGWLLSADDYELSVNGTNISAFPKESISALSALQQSLRIIQAGIPLGEIKGKDLIPEHALAMSNALRREAFPHEDVSYEQAVAYLRKEAIVLAADSPRGYVLLTYKDVPLGFVKNVGNRANNLYPQEWRIRSGYLPEEILVVD
ncbi:methyltransferase RsmF C-terminal domain-like protein [Bacteroides sp. UBA939]|uniref:methyltransferase RsmF C-terminal domain-like protein n=1 Tax=Bacteroides sp. UBA939 TaxID=1946092 RepID=UPI0025BAE8BA|nr:rRNA cytosine-C5-methyltransferase [Bacteroides sp. UBA939]